MPRRPSPHPNEVELEILRVLWRLGPSTVRQVHEGLKADRGGEAPVPVPLRMLQVMTDKGLLARDDSVRPQVYRPAAPAEQTQLGMLDYLLEKAFGGSTKNLLLRAVDARRVSADDLQETLRLLREAERAAESKRGGGRRGKR